MAYRPAWQGHLRFSLVTCPVALYAATSSASDIHFHLVNPKTHNRIRMVATDPDAGPVQRSDLAKGFEIEKDRYILLSDEDIKSVRLESTKTIDIERFVPAADIDRIYWDNPYYLAPEGKLAEEAYGVIREAMRSTDRIGLGRVVISTRERLLALEPRGKGILAFTLHTADEVRDADAIFGGIREARPDPAMTAIATKIIESQEGPFDPSLFIDRYEQALRGLIAEKAKGHRPVQVETPEDTNVVDLMAALRASLKGASGDERHQPGGREPPAPKSRRKRA